MRMAKGDMSEPKMRYDSQKDDVNFIDVQSDPFITTKDDNQKQKLVDIATNVLGLQSIENRALVKHGSDPDNTMNRFASEVMDKKVDEALKAGVSEYAILSTIHSATKLADKHPIIDLASKVLAGAKKLFSKKNKK